MTPAPLPTLSGVDRARFEAEVVPQGRPVKLAGLVGNWPLVAAARAGPAALTAHLKRYANARPAQFWEGPPEMLGRFFYGPGLAGRNYTVREAPIADFLDLLLTGLEAPNAPFRYCGGAPLRQHLPGLAEDHPNPLLDPARDMLVSAWLGGRSRTAAHWDLPQNLACVIAGRRRVTVFPITQAPNLYMGPLDDTLAGQPVSLVDFANPDPARFPRFTDALAQAETAELGPGDALYLPSLWIHHVESLDPMGAMINFWWRDAAAYMASPLFALHHALLSLKELPANERAGWRALFDYYVFHGEAAAHLPEAAQGVLGPNTAGVRERLKAMAARDLR